MKKTLVLGASENPDRYSNKAIVMLREHNHPVVGIGRGEGRVSDVSFSEKREEFTDIHTVTIYLNPVLQKEYYDYILSLHPKRIVFNPGTENAEFEKLAREQGIEVEEACTLVLLTTHQF